MIATRLSPGNDTTVQPGVRIGNVFDLLHRPVAKGILSAN